MKNKIFYLACSALAFIFISCNSWIDSSINNDPNNARDVSMNLLLPSIEANYAYNMGGDIGRFASLFTRHHSGNDRQHLVIYNYTFKESDDDNVWGNLYSGCLNDCNILIKKADASNSPYYGGVARVLMANMMGTATDLWGDIPYSQAFLGNANEKPKFDTQESVYTAIQTLLDDAIVNLNAKTSTFKPGAEDNIYAGNITKWKKLAYTLKARYFLHLSKKNTSAYANALTAIASGLAANADDCQFAFGSDASANNPWFQFVDSRGGDIGIDPFFKSMMLTLKDPRFPAYSPDSVSLGTFYAGASSPVPFATYTESKFIEAEAKLKTGDLVGAKTAYVDAVKASMTRTGVAQVSQDAYLAQTTIVPAGDITLDFIQTQKYIALYTQSETFTEWRRTGIPVIPPVTGTQIPRRFPYPQQERLYNGVNLSTVATGVTLFTPVWWDK